MGPDMASMRGAKLQLGDFCHQVGRNVRLQLFLRLPRFLLRVLQGFFFLAEPTRQAEISYAVFCLKKKTLIHISEPTRPY